MFCFQTSIFFFKKNFFLILVQFYTFMLILSTHLGIQLSSQHFKYGINSKGALILVFGLTRAELNLLIMNEWVPGWNPS